MASINVAKYKAGPAMAIMMHGATDQRLLRNHSNPDIDKSRTADNMALYEGGYTADVARYKSRLEELAKSSRMTKATVTLLAVECPFPGTVDSEGKVDIFTAKKAYNLYCEYIANMYGRENVVNVYLHVDEVHKYRDKDGTEHWSLPHAHAYVLPDAGGYICAKEICTRDSFRRLQRGYDTIYKREIGMDFLSGKEPRHLSVEELKADSLKTGILLSRDKCDRLESQYKTICGKLRSIEAQYKEACAQWDAFENAIQWPEAGTMGEVIVDDSLRPTERQQAIIRGYEQVVDVPEHYADRERQLDEKIDNFDFFEISD